ncbi:MAG: hypothetical protein ACFE75_00425 [Candidatus Hodarchaeota archaeon]
MGDSFEMELSKIQPSQLYISEQKLTKVKEKFNSQHRSSLDLIPIKKLGKIIFYTDGHTRAFAAYQAGFTKIPVIWEDEELDWDLYQICIKWCNDESIYSIADLKDRIIDQNDYELLWYQRCNNLHKKLTINRTEKKIFKNI